MSVAAEWWAKMIESNRQDPTDWRDMILQINHYRTDTTINAETGISATDLAALRRRAMDAPRRNSQREALIRLWGELYGEAL